MQRSSLFLIFLTTLLIARSHGSDADWKPDQSQLPTAPPKEATMLLDSDGKHLFVSMKGEKADWPLENGELISTHHRGNVNHLASTLHFRDAEIHVEFKTPTKGVGNSGIYIHGNYELQIINSYGAKKLEQSIMGSVYGFSPPLVNAARKPGEWQVYDIRYRAPRRDSSEKIVEQGSITAWLNGQRVQLNTRFGEPRSVYHPYRHGTTPYLQTIWKQQKANMTGPVFLQDHNAPVRFRNVWIKPLDEKAFIYEPKN